MSEKETGESETGIGAQLPVNRRVLLLGAVASTLGLASTTGAGSEDDESDRGAPFADEDHAHDGDDLGIEQPLSSIDVETLLVDAYENLLVDGAHVSSIRYYLKDDFGDGELTDRQGRVVGAFLDSVESRETPPIGEYRPEWSVEDRAGDAFVEDGAMVTEGDSHVSTPSTFETGEWSFDFRVDGNASFYITLMADAEFEFDNSWEVRFSGSSLSLEKRENYQETGGRDAVTSVITTTWDNDDAEHTIRVTREVIDDDIAEFELYYDGELVGTTEDEFVPDTKYFRVRNIGTPRLEVSNVEVGAQLRVDAGVDPDTIVAEEVSARERLTVPVLDADPSNPTPGDIWLREDL